MPVEFYSATVAYCAVKVIHETVFPEQREKKQLEESLAEIKEQEEEMSRANRALTIRLEDVQVRSSVCEDHLCGFTPLMLCVSVEELCQTEQRAQGAGGEITRGEVSEGAVQKHEEQHRG